jgi:hypothetical protein
MKDLIIQIRAVRMQEAPARYLKVLFLAPVMK